MTDDLDRYLAALPDKIRREVGGVVRDQAQMLSDAQRDALRGLEQAPAETGDLEDSCTVVRGTDDLEWIVQAGGDETTGDVRTGSGVDFDYGEAFEFGTSRQQARPFFWPTYREKRDGIRQAIASAVEKAIK